VTSRTRIQLLKAGTFALACVPLAKIGVDAFTAGLGANPIEAILNRLGFWTLTFLTLSLVPTPARAILGLAWPIRIRRMLGLFAFSYGLLHVTFYVGVDQGLDLGLVAEDVTKRGFQAVGMTALLLLAPLAVTSTDGWVRRLGYARWKKLHRLVYVAAILGVVHFTWRVKADLRRPGIFALAIGALLLARLVPWIARTAARRRASMSRSGRAPGARPAA
jgi:methionine sulfoxide reductase heme-binding subunit